MNFVFDIDGTICFDGENIDQRIVDTINEAKEYGHRVVLASARSYRDVLPIIRDKFHPDYVVGLNGSMVNKNGTLQMFKDITKELFDTLSSFCIKNNMPFFVDDLFDYHSFKSEKIPFFPFVDQLKIANSIELKKVNFPLKMVINVKDHQTTVDELQDIVDSKIAETMYHEGEKLFYINPKGVNKATTLKALFDEYLCFGNDKNDIEMFKNAIYSVQVGDYEGLKDYADLQISDGENNIEKICETIKELYEKYSLK